MTCNKAKNVTASNERTELSLTQTVKPTWNMLKLDQKRF